MTRFPLMFAWSVAPLLACAAAVSCRPTIALADPAPPASVPAASAGESRADEARAAADEARSAADEAKLEAQLEAARKELDEAAHQVAELTEQLSRPVIESFMGLDGEHSRAIIGVQLDPAAGGPGARVREVSPGGPAAEAGIRAGDVIVAVNGTEVKGENPARTVMRLMRPVKPDSKVSVRVLRAGAPHEFTVVARPGPGLFLARFPGFEGPELLAGHGETHLIHGPVMDLELATLTAQLGRYFGSDKGVLVVRAPAAGVLKLEDGDVILAIDGRVPASGSHATRILASYQPGEKLTLRILRLHKPLDLETTLPARPEPRHAHDGMRGVAPPPPATPDT
ncbi:MAG TPA: PDZ domain-containing protein [Steroidobacteraceae bacterium]|nr:PDZ domain-containing protein [Steroidobacteraceae bacterium]